APVVAVAIRSGSVELGTAGGMRAEVRGHLTRRARGHGGPEQVAWERASAPEARDERGPRASARVTPAPPGAFRPGRGAACRASVRAVTRYNENDGSTASA